jgi:hypothetical protein
MHTREWLYGLARQRGRVVIRRRQVDLICSAGFSASETRCFPEVGMSSGFTFHLDPFRSLDCPSNVWVRCPGEPLRDAREPLDLGGKLFSSGNELDRRLRRTKKNFLFRFLRTWTAVNGAQTASSSSVLAICFNRFAMARSCFHGRMRIVWLTLGAVGPPRTRRRVARQAPPAVRTSAASRRRDSTATAPHRASTAISGECFVSFRPRRRRHCRTDRA